MGKKRLQIPIARFEPARPLAKDVFLHLVLNQRSVRIGEAHGALDPELLERIKSKGYSHLEINCEDENGDPATYPIYLEASPSEAAATKLAPAPREQESATALRAGAPEEEFSREVSGGEAFAEGQTLVKGQAGHEEGQILVKSTAEEEPNTEIPAGPDAVEESEEKLRAAEEEENSAQAFGKESDDAGGVNVGGETDIAEEEESFAAATAEIAPVLFKTRAEEKEKDSAIFRLEQKLEGAKETLLVGGKFALAEEKASILKDAKSSILAAKISDRIVELKQQPATTEDSDHELADLAISLKTAEAGDDLPPEALERFTVNKEMDEVETIISADRPVADVVVELSEHLATFAKSREEAKRLMESDEDTNGEFGPLKKSSSHRDLPHVASRLAAYLGHSLGYVNGNFLQDLAISSACHFSKRLGKSIDDSALPPLAKLLAEKAYENDDTINDAREILVFLELYLDDPECDRTEKEFIQKIFQRASANATQTQAVGNWNLKCWTAFLEQGGPTLEAHSLCNRAAASAIKVLRAHEKN